MKQDFRTYQNRRDGQPGDVDVNEILFRRRKTEGVQIDAYHGARFSGEGAKNGHRAVVFSQDSRNRFFELTLFRFIL